MDYNALEVLWRSKFMDYSESVDWELAKHNGFSLINLVSSPTWRPRRRSE